MIHLAGRRCCALDRSRRLVGRYELEPLQRRCFVACCFNATCVRGQQAKLTYCVAFLGMGENPPLDSDEGDGRVCVPWMIAAALD